MSILINGMEMPTSCDECRLMVFEDTNCAPELYCGCPIVFKAHPQGIGHRPDYCPLIPIPPHVRPVVVCADCEYNNHCLTQEFVDDCGKIPLDRNTFFCADGKKREEN